MKHSLINSKPFVAATLLLAALIQVGCKENTLINAKVSPADNALNVYSDTLPCITHTFNDDTTLTSSNFEGLAVFHGIGSIIDPYFGQMTGTSYFQVVPTSLSNVIYENATIDSAVLVMPYTGFTYGDTTDQNATQSYQVFYLQDTMGLGNYYSYSNKPIDAGAPLSDPATVNIYHLKDSVYTTGRNHSGLRIRLKLPAFTAHLLPAISGLASSATPTADFLRDFKGICVRVADASRASTAYPYFHLNGTGDYFRAGIMVYYHKNAVPETELTENYGFVTAVAGHFSNIERSYGRYPISALYRSTAANDSVVALQNEPGAGIDVVVTGIKGLPSGIINKAELQITLLGHNNPAAFQAPVRLYPVGISTGVYPTGQAAGQEYIVADRYPLSSVSAFTILDGGLHGYTFGSTAVQTYTIGVPRELMNAIALKTDSLHYHLTGTTDLQGAYHLVAGGGNYPDLLYRAKLIVVYSKLNK